MSAMDSDGDEKDDTKRKVRNLSEKKRRDQFNTLVNELSSMVSTNARKMDKSSILKSTIAYLKNHNETTMRSRAHEVQADWKPAFLINEEFTYLLIEALEGFVMVLSSSGTIHYVSESVLSLLGHNPADMINKNIFDLTYEEDRPHMFSILQNNGNVLDILSQSAKDQAIRFECHIRRGGEAVYELVQISGHFRNNTEHVENSNFDNGGHTEQDSASSVLFVCTGRLKSPKLIRDVSLVDTDRNEFTSRHSLEWKFLFLDHRAPPIIGYLPFEVLGTSGYDYYHIDDLEKINSCHEDLMQKGELTSCCYRFLTKGQQWIWLQTRFYITYHQWNSKPEFVVCTHRVVNCLEESKGMKQEDATNGAAETVPGASCNPAEEPATVPLPTLSPSYMSDVSDAFSTYQPSRPSSVKSMSASSTVGSTISMDTHSTLAANNTLHTGWRANRTPSQRYSNMSDTATSVSGDSRSSHRSTIETPVLPSADSQSQRANAVQHFGHMHITQKADDICMVPQHGMGAQYLQPMPYVSAVVPIQVPVIVTTDAVQIQTRSDSQVNDSQEQLQRKHEQLQLMMLRQQEELRQVKEQLLLARLGMLQPLNLQTTYMTLEEMQQTTLALQQAQAAFEQPPPRPAIMEVPHQPDQLSDNPHMAQ